MPTLSTTPLPAYGWVRVELDWTDTASVTYARVDRVDPATGEVTPIRPHTLYSGWYQGLSGGRATLYDTEAPLDTPFYYRTASLNEPDLTYSPLVSDPFTRMVSNGWGVAGTGQTWETFGGSAADYSVTED